MAHLHPPQKQTWGCTGVQGVRAIAALNRVPVLGGQRARGNARNADTEISRRQRETCRVVRPRHCRDVRIDFHRSDLLTLRTIQHELIIPLSVQRRFREIPGQRSAGSATLRDLDRFDYCHNVRHRNGPSVLRIEDTIKC